MNDRLEPALAAWTVSEGDYPAQGGIGEQISFLLRYAILAPSSHNTQPWLFRVGERSLELHADRTRALAVVDPEDRALVISCGAALANFCVAARHFGLAPTVESLPRSGDDDLLARVTLGPGEPPGPGLEELFHAIPERRSNRQAYEDRDVPADLARQLVTDASQHGVSLHLVRGRDREAVAELVAEGDRIQMSNKHFRRELAAWVHPNRSRSRDGMRGYGFGFGDLMSYAGPLVIRTFDLGGGQSAKDRALAEGAPLLAVLGTARDDKAAWLDAGQALQMVLLRARAAGVWCSYLNQPIEVPELRPRLAQQIGCQQGHPQLLLRIGYAPPVRPAPRRRVSEVLLETATVGRQTDR